MQGGDIFGQETHLLRQSALDDLVIFVEPEGESFAKENLLAHSLLDQGAHLINRRRRSPLRKPVHRQLTEVVLRQHDLISSVDPISGRVQ